MPYDYKISKDAEIRSDGDSIHQNFMDMAKAKIEKARKEGRALTGDDFATISRGLNFAMKETLSNLLKEHNRSLIVNKVIKK